MLHGPLVQLQGRLLAWIRSKLQLAGFTKSRYSDGHTDDEEDPDRWQESKSVSRVLPPPDVLL
jgi:hypothetical protein